MKKDDVEFEVNPKITSLIFTIAVVECAKYVYISAYFQNSAFQP